MLWRAFDWRSDSFTYWPHMYPLIWMWGLGNTPLGSRPKHERDKVLIMILSKHINTKNQCLKLSFFQNLAYPHLLLQLSFIWWWWYIRSKGWALLLWSYYISIFLSQVLHGVHGMGNQFLLVCEILFLASILCNLILINHYHTDFHQILPFSQRER